MMNPPWGGVSVPARATDSNRTRLLVTEDAGHPPSRVASPADRRDMSYRQPPGLQVVPGLAGENVNGSTPA